jgi:hypothetical protein
LLHLRVGRALASTLCRAVVTEVIRLVSGCGTLGGPPRHRPREDVVFHIKQGPARDILEHPNPDQYAGQRIFGVRREDYVYLVPFVEDEHTVFLKTIIPSRKATKEYLGEESDHED